MENSGAPHLDSEMGASTALLTPEELVIPIKAKDPLLHGEPV
jgi:hypothetical protein